MIIHLLSPEHCNKLLHSPKDLLLHSLQWYFLQSLLNELDFLISSVRYHLSVLENINGRFIIAQNPHRIDLYFDDCQSNMKCCQCCLHFWHLLLLITNVHILSRTITLVMSILAAFQTLDIGKFQKIFIQWFYILCFLFFAVSYEGNLVQPALT